MTRTETPSEYHSIVSPIDETSQFVNEECGEEQEQDSEFETPTLEPLKGDGHRRQISISNNVKRNFKDRRIYVNLRTGLPVRPPTSFGLFKHALRRQAKDSKVEFQEFHKRAIKAWQKIGENEKAAYVERSRVLADEFKKIEVPYLRKKVRELKNQLKDIRRNYHLRLRHPPPAIAALDTDDEVIEEEDDDNNTYNDNENNSVAHRNMNSRNKQRS